MTSARSEVAQQIDLEQLRYSAVWEDHELLEQGLRIGPDDDVLSITSAGDNVLALLLQEPRSITAIDMSVAQTALFELKLAGIRTLQHPQFLELLGLAPGDPTAVYDSIRSELPESSSAYWDARRDVLAGGVTTAGRLERYFLNFVTEQLSNLWPADLVDRLQAAPSVAEQAELFEREAFTPDLQTAFSDYFGRESMAKRGRTEAQFAYVLDGDVGGYFLRRFHNVCTTLSMRDNFYVERFLTGTIRDLENGPLYLRAAEFGRLRSLLDRVTVVEAELETHLAEVAPGAYSKVQLSDVFEYMSEDAANHVFEQLAHAIRPGGRLAYWNLLVPRERPDSLASRLRPLTQEAQRLWRGDRSWFYRAFRLEEVLA